MKRLLSVLLASTLAAATVAACSDPAATDDSAAVAQGIVGGTEARAYEGAALVDIEQNGQVRSICSGALIAPRVVLTAGHCVVGNATGFRLTFPYATGGAQRARSSKRGIVYDYTSTSGNVNPNQRDVALVVLDTPVKLRVFPKVAREMVGANVGVVKVGRIDNGRASNTALFASTPMRVSPGNNSGFPYSYISSEVIQPGDSGGPNFVSGSSPPTIVAVNSGAGGGTEVLARVDLLATWIDQRVAENGGYDSTSDAGADAAPEAGTDAGTDARPDASPTPDAGADAATPPESAPSSDGGKKKKPPRDPSAEEEEEEEDEASPTSSAGPRPGRTTLPPASSGCSVPASGAAFDGGSFALMLGVAMVLGRRRRARKA